MLGNSKALTSTAKRRVIRAAIAFPFPPTARRLPLGRMVTTATALAPVTFVFTHGIALQVLGNSKALTSTAKRRMMLAARAFPFPPTARRLPLGRLITTATALAPVTFVFTHGIALQVLGNSKALTSTAKRRVIVAAGAFPFPPTARRLPLGRLITTATALTPVTCGCTLFRVLRLLKAALMRTRRTIILKRMSTTARVSYTAVPLQMLVTMIRMQHSDDGSCVFYCPGCTDEVACNYDSEAIQEDGSCEYPVDLYGFDYVDCEGQCLSDEDGDGVCLEDEIYGCTEIEACNFNGEATENDGTCEFQSCAGCMDEEACNFDPEATLGDVSCEYESCAGCMYEFACNYDPEATIADNDTCEFGTCPGCTDPEACNYNPTVTEDDGSCLYIDECGVCGGFGFAEGTCDCEGSVAESGYNCDGSCVIDTDGDGVCDEFEITGCTDIEAENYDETATDDDGSCVMDWMQLGQDIDGEAAGDQSGYSVSLSSDGTTVAIGAYGNDGNGSYSGHVRIYAWNSATSAWEQQGADIDGEAADDESGWSVSLSSDGTTVAIGAYYNDGNGSYSGHVRIYAWNSATSAWEQQGADIDGEAADDRSGYSVSLSSDGTTVAIGALWNDGNGSYSGHVRIYAWNSATSAWEQQGADIDGEAAE